MNRAFTRDDEKQPREHFRIQAGEENSPRKLGKNHRVSVTRSTRPPNRKCHIYVQTRTRKPGQLTDSGGGSSPGPRPATPVSTVCGQGMQPRRSKHRNLCHEISFSGSPAASPHITRAYAAGHHSRLDSWPFDRGIQCISALQTASFHFTVRYRVFVCTGGCCPYLADGGARLRLRCDGSMAQRAASGQVGRASGLTKWGGLLLVQHGQTAGRHSASEWCGSVVFYPPGAAGGVFRPFGPPCQWSWTCSACPDRSPPRDNIWSEGASSIHRPSLSPRSIPFVLLGPSPSHPSTRSAGRPCISVVPGAGSLLWAIGGGRGFLMAGFCCGFG
jgi:hypothetical protein